MKKLNIMQDYAFWNKFRGIGQILETNTIYNMDCGEGLKCIPSNSVDLCLTDAPYELSTKMGKPIKGLNSSTYLKEIAYMCDGFDTAILDEIVRVLKRINCFFYCSSKQLHFYLKYFKDKNVEYKLLSWAKRNSPPLCNNTYVSSCEYILYVCEKGMLAELNLATDHYIASRPNIKKTDEFYHPTVKHTNQLIDFIKAASKEGNLVLDPFMGSGSTAVAAIESGRRFIGFELMPKYHAICEKRVAKTLAEHPEYTYSPEALLPERDILYADAPEMLETIEECSIDMAYFDVSNEETIPFDFIEGVIAKQEKPNLYIMMEDSQFPEILMHFAEQDYKYDIIENYQNTGTKHLMFFRKGGVKLYGNYHTKQKFYEDTRDMNKPNQDCISYPLMERLLENSTLPGQTVFCSGGYGTTLECCLNYGRHFIAYEPDPDKFQHCAKVIEELSSFEMGTPEICDMKDFLPEESPYQFDDIA